MLEKDILSSAVDTITRKPVTIEVSVKPNGKLDKILMSLGLKKRVLSYVISPLLVGNRKRVSIRSQRIPDDFLKDGLVKALLDPSFIDDCIYAVAIGIQNNRNEPSEKLLKFVEFQFDDTDLYNVLDAIFGRIDLQAFTKSIILMKGSNVLNVPEPVAMSAITPE